MANIADYAIGTVLTAPTPATSGTTIVLNSGQGSIMPTNLPWKATAVPPGVIPTLSNCEKVLVTARTSDTLTVTRAQSPTTAKSIAAGWYIINSVFTEDQFNASMTMGEVLGGTPNGVLTAFTTSTNFTIIAVYKNGVRMTQGVGKDYVVTNSTTVTFSTPPASLSVLTADYMVGALININNSNSLIQKEAVTGTINGSNAVFTTLRPYIGSSLEVYVNGLAQGNTYVTETSPSVGTFTLDVAPLTGDIIHVSYQSSTGVYANADTVDSYHANATPTANTIPVLDSNGKMPQSTIATEIGYAESATPTLGITTTITDLTGVSATVTVPSGATILVEIFVPQIYSTVDNDRLDLSIREGSTNLAVAYNLGTVSSKGWGGAYVRKRLQPSAGSHTYKASLVRGIGSGTLSTYCDAANTANVQIRIV